MKPERGELFPTVTLRLIETITIAAKRAGCGGGRAANAQPPHANERQNSTLICLLTLNVKVKLLVKWKG